MKENDKEDEESENSSSHNLINLFSKTDSNIKNEKTQNKNIGQDTETSFDKIILKKVQKEEKELKMQIQLKERQKLLKKLSSCIRKDYIVFFFILLSSSFNYNYFFLPFIVIGMMYLFCIENLNWKPLRLKYFLEIFSIGYASYLLLFKIVIFLLIKNNDELVLQTKKSLFIDLGCCTLKDLDSNSYFILNFMPEIIIIAASGYGILISFQSRLLKPSDLDTKNITHLKLSKYILILYLLIVLFTMFNLSYLSLFYVICIQFLILLISVKFTERIIKSLFKIIINVLIVLISLQIMLTNYLNIPSVQQKYQNQYNENEDEFEIKNYFTWTQIGIDITTSEKGKDAFIKFMGYFFSIINLIVLINTINKLKLENNSENNTSENNNKIQINKKNGIFTKAMNKIMKFLYHPVFNFEASRILSILWTYIYRNIYSLGILIFIFISFFSAHTKRNKFLVICILSPMLILSLCSAHISNIKGIFDGITDLERMNFSRLGFVKYDYIYLEYLLGHLFFIIVMFLINSIYTSELVPKDIEAKVKEEKPKKIEMQILKKINKLDESILPKDQKKNNINESTFSINDNDNDNDNEDRYSMDDKYLNEKRYIVEDNRPKDINAEKKKVYLYIKPDGTFGFLSLLSKGILLNIDKFTLIVMYFVSVYTVNLMHVILVSILIFQIISPGKLNYCYKVNALIFQLLYLIEFIIDLMKINYLETFNKYKSLLQFLIVYNEDMHSNDIEIFIYGVIYCFYFQYRTCNIKSIKSLLSNKKISVEEYTKNKLKNYPKIQSFLFILGNISLHIYLWGLFGAFIFFNGYFEINFLFGIKLFIFLVCTYQFIFLLQSLSTDYSNIKCFQIFNRIFLFFCCLNTLGVYLFQFLCKDFLSIKDTIKQKQKENNFFIKNLPNFGFTIYPEAHLYYNFLPHFLTTFITVLFIWRTEATLDLMLKNSYRRKTTMNHIEKEKTKKKNADKERMKKIKEEQNEFIQDKLYTDKYEENYNHIKEKSRMLLKINIVLFITQCYWLMLFFAVGFIFSRYDLSFSMLLYVFIFGIYSMKMFHRIISKLRNYIKNRSYYISKVIRYSIVEKPKNREINKIYRKIIFRYLLLFSFLYILLIYFYGIFNLYQHGCNPELFKGCDPSHSEIFESDKDDDIFHKNIEAEIKSYAFLFGIHFDVRKENILKVSFVHLILTILIILDIYNQKISSHYSNLSENLQSELQDLVNENNVLQKYADIADLNILIKIGLSLAGINISSVKKNKSFHKPSDKFSNKEGSRSIQKIEDIISKNSISLISEEGEGESRNNSINLSNDDISNLISKNESGKNEEKEDDDEPLAIDEPKQNVPECYDLNEKDPCNMFLHNKHIKRFINMIKKSNENEQQLSVCNIKERIIRFIKTFFEELIIFISLCLALSKLSIWTFIYFLVTFFIIFSKKTMFKFYLLYCFIYIGIIVQSFWFLLNINIKTSPRTDDTSIFDVLNKTMSIPIYKEYFNMDEKEGYFFGMGITKSQVNYLLLEFIQVIILYFYLNIFSYSIYQDILNLGESSGSEQKIDFQSLNMEQGSIEQVKSMTEMEFLQYKECLSCYDFNIGNNLKDFFHLLKIDNTIAENPFETVQKSKLNLKEIKNPVLKELIEYRMLTKQYRDNIEKRETKKYKPLPSSLLKIQKILYLYFHCFILILIIMLSLMTPGFLSAIYFGVCFYYLMKSDCLYLGQEYYYPKAVKRTLRVIVLIDITLQGVYQIPFFSMKDDDVRFKIFRALGLIKAMDINDDEINTIQQFEIYAKAIIYFFMSVQHFIYNSKNFKRYYLGYLLENKYKTNKNSLINSFTFNNDRVKIYHKSLSIRQKNMEAMDDLKKIISELNAKLNQMGQKLFTKKNQDKNEKPPENIQNIINKEPKINNIENNNQNHNPNGGNLQIIDTSKNDNKKISNNNLIKSQYESILDSIQSSNKPKADLEEEEIKERIKSMVCDRFITKIYLWLHKHSANYKNVAKDAKVDFDIETIKGETKIKSIIETDINLALSILDLSGLDKNDMKEIEKLIESQFDRKKKEYLEEQKFREKRSRTYIDKFKKFGNNLLKLNRFAKTVFKFNPNLDGNVNMRYNGGIDIVELFRLKTEKEKEEKEKREKELEIKRKKIEHIEELFETKLFKKYLTTSYQLKHILKFLNSFFINNFNWVCYFFMILDHMLNGAVITLVYPISIFCYALLEYPRPKNFYWMGCLIYTMIILFIKFIIQLKIILLFISEDTYSELLMNLYNNRIGFKYYSSTFSKDFLEYIIFDIIIVFTIAVNRNLLLTEGLWFKREEEIENIYQASERISIYKMKKYPNKIEAMKDLLLKYIYTPKEIVNIKKILGKKKYKVDEVKHKFPFFEEKAINPEYNEAQKSYYNRMFTKIRNEKPGNDYYAGYTLVMFLICIYILIFYTKMDQDRTYGSVNLDITQFSGAMVIYLIFHIIILAYDRIIFVMQNRDNIKYEYYFYKRNEKNGQGELISETELNRLKSEISKNNINMRFDNISLKEIDVLKKEYNILFIQKEQFNKPLLNKYLLHILTSIFSHLMIFYFFPIKGNTNLGNKNYCEEEDTSCNDFTKNNYLIIFYLFYLIYLILSGLQVKYGFYDIKRKSLFKKKDDELFSNMCSAFQAIPFLYEIKNSLDWTCTSTCLTLFQWNKFEAIYDTIFDTYCEKSDWDERPIGKRISIKQKLSLGATLTFILILILVIPLILFSSLNPTNKLNNLNAAKISVDLTFNYENGAIKNYNLFENTRADSISDMFKKDDDTIWEKYNYSKSVQTRNFNHAQVQRVIFSETSDRNWDLAGPHIKSLIKLLNLTDDNDLSSIEINIGYELTRPLPAEAQTCSNTFKVKILDQKDNLETSKGAKLLNDLRNALENCSDINVIIDNAYSPPLRLTSASDVNVIEDEKYFFKKSVQIGFEGCTIENNKNNYINSYYTIKTIENGKTEPLELHIFSDQISETTSGYSVLTFYISFVLLAGSYIRDFLANEPEKIMLGEMPHPKKIVELCEGIKISRYSYDFKNEEYLYTILIELMRSPDYLKIITDSSLDHFKLREAMTEKN